MDTLTKKDKLTLQVSLALVAGMFSLVPIAHGAPVLEQVVSGGALVKQSSDNSVTAVIPSNTEGVSNNVINWNDFSVGESEKVVFDAKDASGVSYAKQNNYLNIVTGNGTSYVNGKMCGGNDVYLVNPNGVIIGQDAHIDVGNLYVSTQDLSKHDVLKPKNTWDGSPILNPSDVKNEIVNMGEIQANSVYMEGTNIRFLNTSKTLYKPVKDTSSTVSNTLLNSKNVDETTGTATLNGTVTLKATGYVHVGYEATGEIKKDDSGTSGQYSEAKISTDTSATSLGYDITSSSSKYAAEEYDYALVRNGYELQNMNSNKSLNYMLADNIEYSYAKNISNFTPIGANAANAFKGKFDGNFFEIKNICIPNNKSVQYAGLFGFTDGARIENVKVNNAVIYGKNSTQAGVGGIAGYAKDTTFINVANTVFEPLDDQQGKVVTTGSNSSTIAVGGLVGWSEGSTQITGSYNEASVYNGSGLVGKIINHGLTLKDSYNAGTIYNGRQTGSTAYETYYGLFGGEAASSKIENLYNSGTFKQIDLKNVYNDDNNKGVGKVDGTLPSSVISNIATSTSRSDYPGFFSGTETSNNMWRIYEGHSLPLLRSFLKANGHGTIALNYNVGLFTEKGDTTPRAIIPGSAAKNLTYNGYYMGVAKDKSGSILSSDNARNLDSSKIGYNDTKIRDVTADGESGVNFFYSVGGQNGYDLADSSIKVVARNLLPVSGDVKITKVYDGTNDAKSAFGDALTLSDSAVDVAEIYNNGGTVNGITYKPGTLVETGLVKVTKSDGTVLRTDAVTLDTKNLKATYATGVDVIEGDTINLTFPADPNSMLTASSDTDHATDYKNYKFDTTPFDSGAIKVIGDITQRPVQVSLKQDSGIDKIYDGTFNVIDAVAPEDASKENPEKHKYLTDNVNVEKYDAQNDNGRGIIASDQVNVVVSSAYYSTDGTAAKKIAQANTTETAYQAVYNLEFSGGAAKIGNYKFQDATGNDITDNVLTGTGTIAKRNVTLDDIAFTKNGNVVNEYTKKYDYSSAYDGVDGVTFNSGAVATKGEAVSQAKVEGVLEKDAGAFQFTLGTGDNAPKFYNGDTDSSDAVVTVADASHVKFVLAAPSSSSSSVLNNYTLNGEDVKGGNVSVYREGSITKRPITIGLLTDKGIDKTYDATADVVDSKSLGYEGFQGTAASGTVTTKGYVGYDADTKYKLTADNLGQSLNDGTNFSINAVYTNEAAVGSATTTNAADVYVDDSGSVAAKKVIYTVGLTGDYAGNYILNGDEDNSIKLTASGTINPRKITGITFADVSKKYDGTADVGEVNGVTQTKNVVTITGVTIDTSDGIIADATTGLLGNDTYDSVLNITKSNIAGQYGTPTSQGGNDSTFVANSHAYDLDRNGEGEERRVQYTRVRSLTSNNHNYTLAGIDDTQYGKGRIDPLTVDEISTSGTGKIEKVYDGTANVVGGYHPVYSHSTDGNNDIISVTYTKSNDDDVKNALGTISASGEGVGGDRVTFSLTNNDYSVDTGKTAYDSEHVDDVSKIVYAVDISGTNGDYVLADTGTGYTKEDGLAKINKENSGLITSRVLYTKGVTNLAKTYDGGVEVKNSGGTVLTGDNVVSIKDKDNISGLTGNDGVKNVSTAVYSGDTRDGYAAKDANVYTDGVQTTKEGAKKVTYTVKLSGNHAHNDYVIYKDTNNDGYYAPGDTYTLSGNNIEQADLKVSFGKISKTYDTNAYVMDHTEGETTTSVALDSGSTTANIEGMVSDDNVKFTTQDTSAFQETESLGAADVGTHQVKYDLISTSTDLKNYRLVGSDGTALEFQKNGDTYTVTAYGDGEITTRTIEDITAIIDSVSKVYDGNTSLIYDHTIESLNYDESQNKDKVTSIDSVKSLKLGTLSTITSGFSVDESNTKFDDADAAEGKIITYTLKINKDVLSNYEMGDSLGGHWSTDGSNYIYTTTTKDNSITAKNVYATLNDTGKMANPTKKYDGGNTLLEVAKSGNSTVNQTAANSYVTINGLVKGDTAYTVTPTYDDANVATDSAGNVQSKANVVNYLVGGLSTNYNLKSKDTNATVDEAKRTVNLQGMGTVEPKGLTLNATIAQKVYDMESDVDLAAGDGVTSVPKFELDGLVGTDKISIATEGNDAIKGEYGTYADGSFTADPNVAYVDPAAGYVSSNVGYKSVQYSNAAGSFLADNDSTRLTNYTLANNDAQIYDAENDKLTFTADKQKGKITKLAVNDITANIDSVSKVYDGTDALHYVHNEDNGYYNIEKYGDQVESANAADAVKSISLGGTLELTDKTKFSVDETNSKFIGDKAADVGADKEADYVLTVDKEVIRNLDVNGGDGTIDGDGNYIFHEKTDGNFITQKNIYAYLSEDGQKANPTKDYNGGTDLLKIAKDGAETVDQAKAKSYVTVKGLMNGDSYTIAANYTGKDVIVDGDGKVQAGAHTVNYEINDISGNYKLYTGESLDNINSDSNVLTGKGTINPKAITISAGYAEKAYDTNADVNLVHQATSDTADKYPDFTVNGAIVGEGITVNHTGDDNSIKGKYGIYNDGIFTEDANVAYKAGTVNYADEDVAFKDVEYSNVQGALVAGDNTLLTNYRIANDEYDADHDTLTFAADQEKGKITKRTISSIDTEWPDEVIKEYDGTQYMTDEEAQNGFKILGVSEIGDTSIKIPIKYDTDYAAYGYKDSAGIHDVKDVNPSSSLEDKYYVYYHINSLSDDDLRNFKLTGNADGSAYDNYYTSKDKVGTITPRVLSGKATDALQEKIYDGKTAAEAGTNYFNIDDDDLVVLDRDNLTSAIDVVGDYENANANIDPDSAAANGGKTINYTIAWKDGQGSRNYTFADGNGGYKIDGNADEDYQSNGDIRRRKVYVVDNGGEVVTKPYDGGTALPDGATPGSRFELADPNDTAKTGVIEDEKKIVTLNKENIKGEYVSPDVVRNKNGEVVNTGVKYKNFALDGDVNNNYYLTVDKNNPTGSLPNNSEAQGYVNGADGIVITEEKGGKITPKALTVNVINSPEKEYDGGEEVTGEYENGKGYASVHNLAVKVDGNVIDDNNRTVNGNELTVKDASTGDEVVITLNGAEYKDKNAGSGNKESNYSLSWKNDNYDLTGEATDKAVGDTFATTAGNLAGTLTDYTGTINPRLVNIKSVDNVVKTYDGNDDVTSDPTFTIDPDDQDVLKNDNLDSSLAISGKYENKNANIYPVEYDEKDRDNFKNVNYKLFWNGGDKEAEKNYKFATTDGAEYDFTTGKGDILRRAVNVTDNGGDVLTREYRGTKDTSLPKADLTNRFAEERNVSGTGSTGIIDADVKLNKDAIKGAYDHNGDVARDAEGNVINKAVTFSGFELQGTVDDTTGFNSKDNYYLTAQAQDGTVKLNGGVESDVAHTIGKNGELLTITEGKGGKITPKAITVNVINSPEKEYNRDFDVNGSKDGIKYASVKNLEVKIGDDVKEGGVLSDTVRTISTGINNDKVTIALNGAKYEDKNVSYNDLGQVQSNKVNYFDLSWDNGNYKLVGESEDITGASGDTMTQGYDADNATFTGRLTDYTGTINPRLIDVTKVDKVVKTYDGDAAVESNPTFNITDADTSNPHFYIDDQDKALLVDDNLDSYLTISGNYENKNANIYPKEYSEEAAEGGKKVNYNLVWNGGDEDARKNYKFADAGEYDITGTGDILRRAVNVTDLGGDVLARDYRGTKDTSLPEANLTNRFAEERNVSGTGSTGIIDADVKLNKDANAIKGAYAPNGDVARDAEGNVINKAVTFSGFELQGTVDGTTGFNSKDNYYLTAQDGTVTLNGGIVSDVAHTIGKNGELLTITEKEGGRIDPRKIYISVEKSPTKVYDGDNLVKNDEKTGTAYASASNLKAAADGADVQRSFGNVNNVTFTLDPGSGESESFDVTLEKATYDNTSTDPEKDNSMDVSRGANREVLKDKITSYNLSWTNGNYDLKSEPASAEAGKQADTFAADGTNGYTDGSGKRTGVLKDYGGEITPKTISVTSMDTSKTYSGKEGYVVANPQVNAEIEGIIAKDMPGNGNVQDFLGLTVGKATYGAPTQAAIDEAQAENAPKNKNATADEIAEAKPWDAAFNRTADPFQHQVAYSGIAITNGNYELADDEFDGTGTINRAVVTAHPKSATIKAGEAMPSFNGTLDGFMDGETMPKTFYTTVENEDGTTTTTSETRQVPLSEYYNDPEFIYWGPEDGVTNRTEGTNPVYGWYLRKEVGVDKDGNEVVSYYKEQKANLDKNYTLVQAEEPSTLVVEPAPRSGGGGGSGSIVSPPVRESTPVYITPSVPTPAAPQPQPVLEVGYVEKPVVADSSVYQNVSKDTSKSANPEAQAAIQYGKKGAGIAAGNDDSGRSTIAIELAEVVNLLGGDVASDGSMSLTNTDSGRKLSVGSTEEGYLSVGAERKEGSIGIETEGENILEEMATKEGSIGIESEEAQAEVRTEDKEGQIELETEEEMLDAEGKESSISLRSEGRDGESEITYSDGDLSILNSLNADKNKEKKGDEEEEDSEKSEKSESREGEAAIAYNDVA